MHCVLQWCNKSYNLLLKVREHYDEDKILSQILLFKSVCLNFHHANIKRAFDKLYS